MIIYFDSVSGEAFLDPTCSVACQSRSIPMIYLLQRYKRHGERTKQVLGARYNIRNGQYMPEEVQLMELGDRVQQQDGRFLT